jgi:hypothetical protein
MYARPHLPFRQELFQLFDILFRRLYLSIINVDVKNEDAMSAMA